MRRHSRRAVIFAALMDQGGGSGALAMVSGDQFNASAAAPLTTPRPAQLGSGALTIVDSNNRMSIAGGQLVFSGAPAAYDRIASGALSRVAGRAFVWTLPTRSTIGVSVMMGLTVNTTTVSSNLSGLKYVSANVIRPMWGTSTLISSFTVGADEHCFAAVERTTGYYLLYRNGRTGPYRLLWVYDAGTDATVYARAGVINTTSAAFTADDWFIADLKESKFTDGFGLATARSATPADGETITHAANTLIDFYWTPGAGETCTLLFRRVDDDNCYKLVCDQAGGTIKLYRREAGSDTELDAGKVQVWAVGTEVRIVVLADMTTIKTLTTISGSGAVEKHTLTAQTIFQTATTAKVSGFSAGRDFISWGVEVELPWPFNGRGLRQYGTFGDSKQANTTWQLAFETEVPTWDQSVALSASGTTLVSWRAPNIGNYIAAATGTPEKFLANIGVNDVTSGLPDETTWKNDYLAVLDAINAKWPAALVYVCKPWKRNFDASCDSLAGWIDAIVAARSTFCRAGHDERIWLKGADDGATMTTDGVHYSAAGNAEAARQWRAVAGI